jgi:hypothetical protein
MLKVGEWLCPSWPNAADYADTSDKFGTAPLHSPELGEALAAIKLPAEVKGKFTSEQRPLCKRMGTPAPLPVHGEGEV